MTHEELKAKALASTDVRQEYDALAPEFELLRRMLQARKQAGLTQEDVAERMGTKRSAVARLESTLALLPVSIRPYSPRCRNMLKPLGTNWLYALCRSSHVELQNEVVSDALFLVKG